MCGFLQFGGLNEHRYGIKKRCWWAIGVEALILRRVLLVTIAVALALSGPAHSKTSKGSPKADDSYVDTRDAGPTWLNYGPGIVRTGRSLVFMHTSNSSMLYDRYVITEKDKNFDRVKEWLSQHLQARLNLTTKVAYGAVRLGCDYMMLYSCDEPPDFELNDDGQAILFLSRQNFSGAGVKSVFHPRNSLHQTGIRMGW